MEKIILGIDPGSLITGFGLVKLEKGKITHLEHGVMDLRKEAGFLERLKLLGTLSFGLLEKLKPDVVAVEEVFLGKNIDSAFKLGHARGLLIFNALKYGAQIKEYSTRLIKKSITGSGASQKEQVQWHLEHLLKVQLHKTPMDASDALALAYHAALQLELERKFQFPKELGIKKELL